AVDRAVAAGTGGRKQQRSSRERTRRRRPDEARDRRKDVHEPHGGPGSLPRGAPVRELEQERHPQGFPIEKQTVLVFAVIPQALPMVGEQDDERTVVETASLQERQES